MIRLFKVAMSPEAKVEVGKVLDSGYIGEGSKVKEFEAALEKVLGHKVLAVNSCTSAIDLALHLCGVGPGDSVIVSPMTCSATVTMVANRKAKIVWADVNPVTGLIDPADVAEKVTRDTKAIIAVDWGGSICDFEKLRGAAIYRGRAIPIIEDAAHAFGSTVSGTSFSGVSKTYNSYWRGDYIAYSFQAIKHLTTGDGGALHMPAHQYKRAKLLRWFGLDRDASESFRCAQTIEEAGYKYHCLNRHTRVRLADGTTRTIINLVATKYSGSVLSVDAAGKLVPMRVTGWHRNKLGDRQWVFLCHDIASGRRGGQRFRDSQEKQGVWLTEDHPVLTQNRGYVQAAQLQPTDWLVTSYDDFSSEQRELMNGTLLGDSCINFKDGVKDVTQSWYAVNHCHKQLEWLEVKKNTLRNFGNVSIRDWVGTIKGKKHKQHGFQIGYSPTFTRLRRQFYPDGVKVVPGDFKASDFTPRMLASWYMDDGVRSGNNATLCTDNFTENDVLRLREMLLQAGYKTTLQRRKRVPSDLSMKKTFAGFTRIGIPAGSPFFHSIAPYVLPCLRYKLPKIVEQALPYDSALWNFEINSPRLLVHPIISVGDTPPGPVRAVYCLDVETTHNFVLANGCVVHNCNDIAAAIGLANIDLALANVEKHRANAMYLNDRLSTTMVNRPLYDFDSSYWLYTILVDNRDGENGFIAKMKAKGIECSPVHSRCDKHPAFRGYSGDSMDGKSPLPGLDHFASREVAIPVGWWLTEADREYVAKSVLECL